MSKNRAKLELIDESSEAHVQVGKKFSVHNLVSFQPKTTPQRQFFDSYQSDIPIIVQLGSAGTGKTVCACYTALYDVLSSDTMPEKVVIFRNCVPEQEQGFLPGDIDEKNEPFEAPYHGVFDEILEFKSNNYNNLKAKNVVEFRNASYNRGTTLYNTVIVVDEAQNMTYRQLHTIITRAGHGSRIVICADFKQNDLENIRGISSGLQQIVDVLNNMPSADIDFVTYTPDDVIRGGIVGRFLKAEDSTCNRR